MPALKLRQALLSEAGERYFRSIPAGSSDVMLSDEDTRRRIVVVVLAAAAHVVDIKSFFKDLLGEKAFEPLEGMDFAVNHVSLYFSSRRSMLTAIGGQSFVSSYGNFGPLNKKVLNQVKLSVDGAPRAAILVLAQCLPSNGLPGFTKKFLDFAVQAAQTLEPDQAILVAVSLNVQ